MTDNYQLFIATIKLYNLCIYPACFVSKHTAAINYNQCILAHDIILYYIYWETQ